MEASLINSYFIAFVILVEFYGLIQSKITLSFFKKRTLEIELKNLANIIIGTYALALTVTGISQLIFIIFNFQTSNFYVYLIGFVWSFLVIFLLVNLDKFSKKLIQNEKNTLGEKKKLELMLGQINVEKSNIKNQIKEFEEQNKSLEDTKAAVLNILDDLETEKENVTRLSERLELATSSAKIGVWEKRLDCDRVFWNDIMYQLYGVDKKSFISSEKNWAELIHPDDREKVISSWKSLKDSDKNFGIQMRIVTPNKAERYIQLYAIVKKNKNGELESIIGVNWDITREKEIELAKTQFISLASHQLRTPLTTIRWYSEMLLGGEFGELTKQQRNFVDEVYVGSRRLTLLVNSLLNVSRLELGTFIVDPSIFDLNKIVEGVIKESDVKINEKKLQVTYQKVQNFEISLDVNLYTIIVQNLITNAVKYSKNGGKIKVENKIVEAGEKFAGHEVVSNGLLLIVSDEGIGVPEDQKAKIFGKMFRADNATKTDTDGTGLGLFMVHEILKQTTGEIWFESKIDVGSTFYVFFPSSGMLKKAGVKKLD